jgi:hypothetical protein
VSLEEIERRITVPLQAWGETHPALEWRDKALELLDELSTDNLSKPNKCDF